MTGADPLPVDPRSLIRSRQYRALLVLASLIGLVVSAASWGFLELVHVLQIGVYEDLPGEFGYDTMPTWWPLPWLALAGFATALAIVRLPGHGGHVPADGLKSGGRPTRPVELPGVLLAATATLGLGLVLGPEGPLIALGMGLAILAIKLVRRDAPDQLLGLMAAAGSFAAVSSIFGSPVIGAVLIIEAAGLGGPMLSVVLLPGLLSAGIGSLVFIGLGSWSGLSTAAWALSPFPLEPFGGPGWGDFAWTVLLSVGAAIVVFAALELARWSKRLVDLSPVVLTTVAGLVVGVLAILFAATTPEPETAVLFSGETAFDGLFASAATISVGTLALLLLFKGLAWSISLGSFRGGPTFPALFLGVVAGLMAGHLPGYEATPGVAALTGAACVATVRLPLASVMIASLLTIKAGLAVTPLVIVAVAVSYLVSEALTAYVDERVGAEPAPAAGAGSAAES
jgi:H+/Cl- antiporter ClcA